MLLKNMIGYVKRNIVGPFGFQRQIVYNSQLQSVFDLQQIV